MARADQLRATGCLLFLAFVRIAQITISGPNMQLLDKDFHPKNQLAGTPRPRQLLSSSSVCFAESAVSSRSSAAATASPAKLTL